MPSHLIGFGPEIAVQIQKGNGKVCDYKYRQIARKDTRATAKVGRVNSVWKTETRPY